MAAVVSLVVLPICIFVHELGHFFVAVAYEWQAKLSPAQVTYSDENVANIQRLYFLAAGPLIDVLQITTGLAILIWLRNQDSDQRGVLYWIGAVLTFVSIKWLLTPIAAEFMPMNDEVQISSLLGWNPMVLPFLVMSLGVIVLAFLVKQHIRSGSIYQLAFLPIFGFLGAGAWMKVVGPLILNAG